MTPCTPGAWTCSLTGDIDLLPCCVLSPTEPVSRASLLHPGRPSVATGQCQAAQCRPWLVHIYFSSFLVHTRAMPAAPRIPGHLQSSLAHASCGGQCPTRPRAPVLPGACLPPPTPPPSTPSAGVPAKHTALGKHPCAALGRSPYPFLWVFLLCCARASWGATYC